MPALYFTWDVTSATVEVGGTVEITYSSDFSARPNDAGVTAQLNGLATATVGSAMSVTFTGVAVGTVTIPYDTDVGGGAITSNALTLTVTAPSDDESYLNKRGLTHFWENIDNIKQDKLTAGTNITIAADNTISASQPTVNDATLTIQRNGTSVGTFTANASSNVTANISVPTKTSDLTNDSDFITSSGTVAKANQLASARNINVTDGAIGIATPFDGTSNISIPIARLMEAYALWGGKVITGDITPDDMGCVDEFGHNKLAFLPAECITAEYSTDGGSTWLDYGLTDAQKVAMMTTVGAGVKAGENTAATASNIANLRGRVRIACCTRAKVLKIYTSTKKFLLNVNTGGARDCKVKIRRRTIADYLSDTETWTDVGTYSVSGWSGWNSIPYTNGLGGNPLSQTGQVGEIEFEFWGETFYGSYVNKLTLLDIRLIGSTNWSTPSELARAGHLYTMDTGQNATFPASVKVTGSLQHGNYTYTLPNKNGTVAMTSDLPSVNDATLTIQKNGTTVQTFTANQSTNATANITVPTQTSDLTNNSGFLTSSTAVTSFNGSTGAITYTAPVTSVNGSTGAITGLQTTANLVTSVSSASTDSQYPSAKLFYDTVGDVETVLQTLNNGGGAQ